MIKLHHAHQTRSMRVLWLLHELGLPFELVVHPFDNSLRSQEYLSLHPVGRVPCLEIDHEVVWESGAAIELLCERYPDARLGREPGSTERAAWLTWLHFAETISQHTAALTQQHVALYEDTMRSPVVMKLEARRIGKCFDAMESVLDGREYLLKGGFSAVDIAVGQAVYMARHFHRLTAHPSVADWYGRLATRPAFNASLPPEGAARLYKQDFYEAWDG
jgi:glutathione S-transferase